MGAASQVLDYLDIDSFDDVGIVRPCRVPLNVWTTYCESFGHTRDGKLPPLSRPCVRLPQVGKYPLGAGVQEKGEGVVPEPTLTIHEQDQRQVRSRQRNTPTQITTPQRLACLLRARQVVEDRMRAYSGAFSAYQQVRDDRSK